MNKYVILHSIYEQVSRDFVSSYGDGKQIISWYEDSAEKQEYIAKDMPGPSQFPCVVDTEAKRIINNPESYEAAIADFESWDAKLNERLEAKIRESRNIILGETDKYMISDYPITEERKSLMVIYRQALRDITDQEGFPTNVVWPEEP